LIAEVERLRPQIGVFGLSRWQQKVLIEQVDLVRVEVEAAIAEAATMRAWAEEAAKAENENADDARRERAAVVAWLRRVATDARDWSERADVYDAIADNIESGEHRRGETK
jgi:pantothenate synthetase